MPIYYLRHNSTYLIAIFAFDAKNETGDETQNTNAGNGNANDGSHKDSGMKGVVSSIRTVNFSNTIELLHDLGTGICVGTLPGRLEETVHIGKFNESIDSDSKTTSRNKNQANRKRYQTTQVVRNGGDTTDNADQQDHTTRNNHTQRNRESEFGAVVIVSDIVINAQTEQGAAASYQQRDKRREPNP